MSVVCVYESENKYIWGLIFQDSESEVFGWKFKFMSLIISFREYERNVQFRTRKTINMQNAIDMTCLCAK